MTVVPLLVIVYVCGILAMFVEIFIPGGVLGFVGFLAMAGSIVAAFATDNPTTGSVLLLVSIALCPMFFWVWKRVIGKYLALKGDEQGFRSSSKFTEELVGTRGQAETDLHPTGIARLGGRRVDVVTRGELLEKGARVEVVEVSGNRVVVREV